MESTPTNKLEDLSSTINPVTILQFVSATRDDERVSIVYNSIAHLRLFDTSIIQHMKSAREAVEHRDRASEEYQKKPPNLPAALLGYTKSIAAAEDATGLAAAYADRSAVLFAMAKYDECLDDVEQALKLAYPDKLKYALLTRRGDCLQIMGKLEDAIKSFHEATKVLPLAADLSEMERKKKLCYISVQLARIDKGYLRDEVYKAKRLRPPPQLADGVNVRVPAVGGCVEIAQNQEWGRHLRATRDIKPGEMLIVEDPYVSILWSTNYQTHCYNCLKRYDALIPCKACQLVMYCSESCRENSWDKAHSLECPLLYLLSRVKQYQFLLTPLRIILLAVKQHGSVLNLHDAVHKMEAANADGRIPGFDDNDRYSSADYGTVHHLVTNSDKLTVQKLWPYALNAALLVKCLECYGALKEELCDGTLKRFVGGLLLRYEMNVASNGYPVDEYGAVVDHAQVVRNKGIGGALYPTSSLINHSCDANTCGYQRGDRVVVTATLPISAGEQVFIDYVGQRLSVQAPSSTRRSFLEEQFHFTCSCKLCTHGLPNEQLKDVLIYWQCNKCHAKLNIQSHSSRVPHVTCHRCKAKNAVERLMSEAEQRLVTFKSLARRARSSCDVTKELGEALTTMHCVGDEKPQQVVYVFKNMMRMNCTQAGNYFLDD